jgi:1-deoxy-D-xylulose-5-phosphate synthase
VTLEDNSVVGGFGGAVTEFFSGREGNIPHVLRIGIPDCFVQHGTQQELHASLGMDAAGIAANVARFVAEHQEKAS